MQPEASPASGFLWVSDRIGNGINLKAQQGLQANLSDAADLAGAALAIADTADNKLCSARPNATSAPW